MPDPISDALLALKTASDVAKLLRGIDRSWEQAELKLRIADLVDALADARMSIAEAQEEILSLRARVSAAQTADDVRERLSVRQNAYFLRRADDVEDGPFCTGCFDTKTNLVRLASVIDMNRRLSYRCPGCRQFFETR